MRGEQEIQRDEKRSAGEQRRARRGVRGTMQHVCLMARVRELWTCGACECQGESRASEVSVGPSE